MKGRQFEELQIQPSAYALYALASAEIALGAVSVGFSLNTALLLRIGLAACEIGVGQAEPIL